MSKPQCKNCEWLESHPDESYCLHPSEQGDGRMIWFDHPQQRRPTWCPIGKECEWCKFKKDCRDMPEDMSCETVKFLMRMCEERENEHVRS